MKFPFIDLNTQYLRLEDEINSSVLEVLKSGQYINGPAVAELEEKLAEFIGVKHVVGCSSGTDALLMVLMAWGVGPGDAGFVPTFTFVSTAEVVALTGATIVFVDIDDKTFNIDSSKLEETIAKVKEESNLQPKVIIPVDLFGLPANYDFITKVAEKEGLLTLEDAAQGFGGEYKRKKLGSFGDAGATSFFPSKPLGAFGDGGAIFINDAKLAKKLVSIREHGMDPQNRYKHLIHGLNARIDTIQAAMLIPKLSVLKDEINKRGNVARRYNEGLDGLVKTPVVPNGCISAWAQYTIVTDERAMLQKSLTANGIPSAVYYPKPLHLQKTYSSLGYTAGSFPVSELAAETVLSLPMGPYLKEDDQDQVIKTIREALG